ncbi:hypothetical protein QAD02_018120 [Eretmocerus hayati]|uniref:Uncharacterized protein n=2 Tax=Eretmocerus hayati TaxID=131215 RepID=A0ACC2PG68_9HYME|nr:hypothetical protein QAD02_018119 [Eretmocerus hayati]KAJ8682328.1 hypothetical protein QAD02_018120 [Eretmocerus hayati]
MVELREELDKQFSRLEQSGGEDVECEKIFNALLKTYKEVSPLMEMKRAEEAFKNLYAKVDAAKSLIAEVVESHLPKEENLIEQFKKLQNQVAHTLSEIGDSAE